MRCLHLTYIRSSSRPRDKNCAYSLAYCKTQKGEHIKTIQSFAQQGYSRVRVNSEVHKINDISKHMLGHIIDPKKKNDIELLIDRVEVNEVNKLRIIESLIHVQKFLMA